LEEASGLCWNITRHEECFPKFFFYDIGALVYYAKIIQWEFPDFSVEGCFDILVELHKRIDKDGYLESIGHRYLLIAKK